MADVGFSDLLEDGVGFGAKTALTIKDVVAFPRRYFVAAQSKDWAGYSPSIRVYVVLLAVSSYLRYLYIGEGQFMTEMYVGQFEQVVSTLSETEDRWTQVDPRELTNTVLDRLFFWSPFISFALYTLFGVVWRAYAEPLNLAVRVRYIYALLIPATIVLLVSTVAMAISPEEIIPALSFIGLFGGALVVSLTAYFGAFPETESAGGKFGRALTLGFALMGVMVLSTLFALLLAMSLSMGEALAATTAL